MTTEEKKQKIEALALQMLEESRQPETHKELALYVGEAWATKHGKEVLAIIKEAKHKQSF